MRVDPSGTHSPVTGTTNATPRPTTRPATAGSGTAAQTGPFALTGELARLLDAVRQTPDVRADAVQSAAAKVASGELNTPDAAVDTAQAAIKSGDLDGDGG